MSKTQDKQKQKTFLQNITNKNCSNQPEIQIKPINRNLLKSINHLENDKKPNSNNKNNTTYKQNSEMKSYTEHEKLKIEFRNVKDFETCNNIENCEENFINLETDRSNKKLIENIFSENLRENNIESISSGANMKILSNTKTKGCDKIFSRNIYKNSNFYSSNENKNYCNNYNLQNINKNNYFDYLNKFKNKKILNMSSFKLDDDCSPKKLLSNTHNKKLYMNNLYSNKLDIGDKLSSKDKLNLCIPKNVTSNFKKLKSSNTTKSNIDKKEKKLRELNLLKNICDSGTENEFGLEEEIREKSFFDINSPFRFYWNIIILIFSVYNAIYGIFRIAFYPMDFESLGFYFEVLCDLIFIMDIIFNFLIPIQDNHIIIYDKSEIAKSYLFSWFIVDLFACVPVNIYLFIKYQIFINQINDKFELQNLEDIIKLNIHNPNTGNFNQENIAYNHFKYTQIETFLGNEFLILQSASFKFIQWLKIIKLSKFFFFEKFFEISKIIDDHSKKRYIREKSRWKNLLKCFNKNSKISKDGKNQNDTQEETALSTFNLNGFLKLFFIFFLLTHISTCLWISVADIGYLPNKENRISWTNSVYDFWQMENFDIYISSLYFNLLTIYTVGYGDIISKNKIERIYNIFLLTIGNLLFSLGISYLSFLFANSNELENKYKDKVKILENLNSKYYLPNVLYKEIKESISNLYKKAHMEKFIIFQSLPLFLRSEMILSMHKKGISDFNFFKYSDKEFIIAVLPLLKNNSLAKNDILISEGGIIEDVYLINSGIISICLDKVFENVEIAELKKNHHFGDAFILLNEKCPYLIKCYSKYSEYLTLSKNDYNKISFLYKKIVMKILEISYQFLANIEKNKQIVMDLFDSGIRLVEVKNIIQSINSWLINKNFNDFFYGYKKTFDNLNSQKNKSNNLKNLLKDPKNINSRNIKEKAIDGEKNFQAQIISLSEFIMNQDIKDIVTFSKTEMKEADFDRIFIISKLKDEEKILIQGEKNIDKNIKSNVNSYNNAFFGDPNVILKRLLSNKNNNDKIINRALPDSPERRKNSLFQNQLLSMGNKIKEFLTEKEDIKLKKKTNNLNGLLNSLNLKDGNLKCELELYDEKGTEVESHDNFDNYENLQNIEKIIQTKLRMFLSMMIEDVTNLGDNKNVGSFLVEDKDFLPLNFLLKFCKKLKIEQKSKNKKEENDKNNERKKIKRIKIKKENKRKNIKGNKSNKEFQINLNYVDIIHDENHKNNDDIIQHQSNTSFLILNENLSKNTDNTHFEDKDSINFIKRDFLGNKCIIKCSIEDNNQTINNKNKKKSHDNNIKISNIKRVENFNEDDNEIELTKKLKTLKSLKSLDENRENFNCDYKYDNFSDRYKNGDPNKNREINKNLKNKNEYDQMIDNLYLADKNFSSLDEIHLIDENDKIKNQNNKNINNNNNEFSNVNVNIISDSEVYRIRKNELKIKKSFNHSEDYKSSKYDQEIMNDNISKYFNKSIENELKNTKRSKNNKILSNLKNRKNNRYSRILRSTTVIIDSDNSHDRKYKNVNIYQIGSINNNNNFILNNKKFEKDIDNRNKELSKRISEDSNLRNNNSHNSKSSILHNEINKLNDNPSLSYIKKRTFDNADLLIESNISIGIINGTFVDYFKSNFLMKEDEVFKSKNNIYSENHQQLKLIKENSCLIKEEKNKKFHLNNCNFEQSNLNSYKSNFDNCASKKPLNTKNSLSIFKNLKNKIKEKFELNLSNLFSKEPNCIFNKYNSDSNLRKVKDLELENKIDEFEIYDSKNNPNNVNNKNFSVGNSKINNFIENKNNNINNIENKKSLEDEFPKNDVKTKRNIILNRLKDSYDRKNFEFVNFYKHEKNCNKENNEIKKINSNSKNFKSNYFQKSKIKEHDVYKRMDRLMNMLLKKFERKIESN